MILCGSSDTTAIVTTHEHTWARNIIRDAAIGGVCVSICPAAIRGRYRQITATIRLTTGWNRTGLSLTKHVGRLDRQWKRHLPTTSVSKAMETSIAGFIQNNACFQRTSQGKTRLRMFKWQTFEQHKRDFPENAYCYYSEIIIIVIWNSTMPKQKCK